MPSWRLVTGICLSFLGMLVGLSWIAFLLVGVPDEAKAASTQQSNVFYWSDGKVMGHRGETNRQNVDLAKISTHMQDAVISAENASFRTDSGVDPKGIARALFNMATGGDTQGGSTITQQYVKNTYLSQEQTLSRKFKEMFISIKVSTTQDKDKILQGYLNTAWYGRGAYGIQAAAQAYFHKDAANLNSNESAFLTALLKNANLYNPDGGVGPGASPQENRQRAEGRWNDVLNAMVKHGKLSQSERDSYKFPKVKGQTVEQGQAGQIGYLMDTAEKYILKKTNLTKKDLELGGFSIHTTFDRKKVKELETAVKKVRKANIDEKLRPGKDKHVQFGAASIAPGDGKIVALYGGGDYVKHFTNNADTQGVPVGSTWKPFVLAAAMDSGTYKSDGPISPMSKYLANDLMKIRNPDGSYVRNKDGSFFLQKNEGTTRWGAITLRKAMEQSINVPFVQLGMDVGMDKVMKMAESAGISHDSMAERNASFALGTSTPSAIRMADAYGTFASSGLRAEPYSVTSVEKEGQPLAGFGKPKTSQTIDDNVANNVTDVLKNVIKNGTGRKALALGRPAAGKTGTTDKNKSAWFVGYTPQLSTAVTMFREDPKKHKLLSMNGVGGKDSIHGGDLPTEVWTEYMRAALEGRTAQDFPSATDLGEVTDGLGVPKPTPSAPPSSTSPTPSDTPSSPSPSPSSSPSNSPSPSPSNSPCRNPVDCTDGGQDGGANGGQDGGPVNGGNSNSGGSNGGNPDGGSTSSSNGTIFGQDGGA
nr:transglycosylase domain-containing protein [Wenjunlia tyrosinilytica]